MSIISNSVHINGGLKNQSLGAAGSTYSGCGAMNAPSHVPSNNEYFVSSNAPVPHQQNGHHHPGMSHHTGNPGMSQPTENGDAQQDESPEIDIIINNVVCTFSVRCHLNLKRIAMEGAHVEFKRENGVIIWILT